MEENWPMGFAPGDIAASLGRHVLPFTNPRVVAPPGRPARHNRPNIVVATPKRCGTHLLIDIILNNLPAYRNRPLYVDLDRAWQYRDVGDRVLDSVDTEIGYVVKTHLPVAHPAATRKPRITDLFDAAIVLTVHRDLAAMETSALRWWSDLEERKVLDTVRADYDLFWSFWRDRPRIALEFGDLFDAERMDAVLADLSARTNVPRTTRYRGPMPRTRSRLIYANKALTRLVGRHAPRIDTTIHTLKTGN